MVKITPIATGPLLLKRNPNTQPYIGPSATSSVSQAQCVTEKTLRLKKEIAALEKTRNAITTI